MKHKRNVGSSGLGLAGSGKGSVERSSAWRRNYDEIFWPGAVVIRSIGRRLVKVYGPAENKQLTLKLNE